jgi:hypothetical protein
VATRRFWNLLHALPEEVQDLAAKNYRLRRSDPKHPSLHFRRLAGNSGLFTVRVGDHYRALGHLEKDTMIWVWAGTHAEYDRLVD